MTQTPTDALRLVPCPFCGGDVINTRSQEMTKGPAYYWHKCETCGAESEGDYGEDVAVAAWNRRAAPASPMPGGGWQDICTAPKDGTKILVWTHHGEVEVSEWYETKGDTYVPEPGTDLFRAVRGKVFFEGWNSNTPTHWMPLPAAPTGEPK